MQERGILESQLPKTVELHSREFFLDVIIIKDGEVFFALLWLPI